MLQAGAIEYNVSTVATTGLIFLPAVYVVPLSRAVITSSMLGAATMSPSLQESAVPLLLLAH
jgi:hypothetical protein